MLFIELIIKLVKYQMKYYTNDVMNEIQGTPIPRNAHLYS